MKKLVIGFILGALFMFSNQAIADTVSLVGKKVGSEAKVIFDGKELSNAVIVNSKSYAPVRDIVEAFGAQVEWQEGVVKISKYPVDYQIQNLKRELIESKEEIERLIGVNEVIENDLIPRFYKNTENVNPESPLHQDNLNKLNEYKETIKENEINIDKLREKIETIEKSIKELESAE